MAIIKQKEQRVGVFVDVQNVYHSAKNLHRASVNFKKVLETAVAGRQLIRAVGYVIKTESGEEEEFFDALVEIGIETKQKDLQIFSSGAKKGDWDVGLAVDAISMAQKLDVVVIVSGDGDFIPLVEYLKHAAGCQVELISFKRSCSSKLIEHVDDFIDMSDKKDQDKVLETLKNAFINDKARTNVTSFTNLGLVQITRKKVKNSLQNILCQPCPYCHGKGIIKSNETICLNIHKELKKIASTTKDFEIVLYVNPDIANEFNYSKRLLIDNIRKNYAKNIIIKKDEKLHHEQYNIFTFSRF